MISSLGYLAMALAFMVALYGLIAVIWGLFDKKAVWFQSARLAAPVVFVLLTISLGVMVFLLLDFRFDVAYVYSVTSRSMPAYLRLTALWGGQAGSLLFWSWLLSAFAMFFIMRRWDDAPDFLPWVLGVMFLSLAFFLILNVFVENPFIRFWHLQDGRRVLATFQPGQAWPLMPQDGQGLNPLLRHPGMILHPPMLYIGFVGFIIPFSAAVASLALAQSDDRWIKISRRWVLIAWVFLTLGLVLGMRWAYDVLGWGGYWGWDPVEIAALMPWLSATALIHSFFLQKRRQRFNRWNLILVCLTFGLVIFGTFLTRSGVLSSVHAFAKSAVGPLFFVYIAVSSLGALGLLVFRWPMLGDSQILDFRFSKEVLILFTNLVLISILAVCFLGVIYPLISELLLDTQITVGPAWYERITGPLFLLLLLLLGLCPLAGWSGLSLKRLGKRFVVVIPLSLIFPLTASLSGVRQVLVLLAIWLVGFALIVIGADYVKQAWAAFRRQRGGLLVAFIHPLRRHLRRYGGALVHVGFVLIGLGIIGIEGLQQQTQVTLSLGESATLGGYAFTFDGLQENDAFEGRQSTSAVLAISQDGTPVGALYPRRDLFLDWQQYATHPGVKSSLMLDLYAILVDWRPVSADQATFKIYINPLVNWLWIGTGVLTVGTIMATWPRTTKKEA